MKYRIEYVAINRIKLFYLIYYRYKKLQERIELQNAINQKKISHHDTKSKRLGSQALKSKNTAITLNKGFSSIIKATDKKTSMVSAVKAGNLSRTNNSSGLSGTNSPEKTELAPFKQNTISERVDVKTSFNF
jgi:hypothetical protein